MKVRDCTKCRKAIEEETKKWYLSQQYRWMNDLLQTAVEHTTVCALAVMERRGRSPEYIKKFFEDLCFMYDFPDFFGKKIRAEDLKAKYEKKYKIDFNDIRLTFESEKEFVKKNG